MCTRCACCTCVHLCMLCCVCVCVGWTGSACLRESAPPGGHMSPAPVLSLRAVRQPPTLAFRNYEALSAAASGRKPEVSVPTAWPSASRGHPREGSNVPVQPYVSERPDPDVSSLWAMAKNRRPGEPHCPTAAATSMSWMDTDRCLQPLGTTHHPQNGCQDLGIRSFRVHPC